MGENPEITNKFVKEAKKSNPKVLISEGTRIDSPSTETEEDIEINAKNLISRGDFADRPLLVQTLEKAKGRVLRLPDRRHRDVLANSAVRRQAIGAAIGGEIAKAAGQHLGRRRPIDGLAGDGDPTFADRLQSKGRAGDFRLAAANQAGDPDHLARSDLQRSVVHTAVRRADILDLQHDIARTMSMRGNNNSILRPVISSTIGRRSGRSSNRRRRPAVAKHREPISDASSSGMRCET